MDVPGVSALAARWYTDPAVFEKELERIFARTWQLACHASEVTGRGDYVVCSLGRASCIVVRDRGGTLRAFHNVCRHRAHELLEGRGNRALIACPYHGWSYGLDGALRHAPGSEHVPGFDRGTIRLAELRLEVFCGFVFVNADPRTRPMAAWYPGVEEELRAFVPDIEDLRPARQEAVEEACNWKVSVENYSECYHCRLAHPAFSTGVIDPVSYDVRPQGHCLRHTTRAAASGSRAYSVDGGDATALQYSSWYLWPAVSFQVYPGRILNTYRWQAAGHRAVTVTRGWYSATGECSDALSKLIRQDLETTVAEDIGLVESVQRGLESGAYRPGPLVVNPLGGVMSEHSIAVLHGWLRDALGDGCPARQER